MYTRAELQQMQSRPWERQLMVAQAKVLEALRDTNGDISVAFSGGKDSCLVADLFADAVSHSTYTNTVRLIFANTTIESHGILEHIKLFREYLSNKYGVNVEVVEVRPKIPWVAWCKKNGLPFISKAQAKAYRYIKADMYFTDTTADEVISHAEQNTYNVKWLYERGFSRTGVLGITGFVYNRQEFGDMFRLAKKWRPLLYSDIMLTEQCCVNIKEKPVGSITGNVMTGEQANESEQRTQKYLKHGCNFKLANGEYHSRPLGPMSKDAVLRSIVYRNIPIASDYGDVVCGECCYCSGAQRTGCVLCGFGIQFDKYRFSRLVGTAEEVRLRYAFTSVEDGGLGYGRVIRFLNENCGTDIIIP